MSGDETVLKVDSSVWKLLVALLAGLGVGGGTATGIVSSPPVITESGKPSPALKMYVEEVARHAVDDYEEEASRKAAEDEAWRDQMTHMMRLVCRAVDVPGDECDTF